MKTALQELIEDLQDMCPDYYNNNYNWLHNLLDKEKQQVIDAYEEGQRAEVKQEFWTKGNKYFTETFKTK